MASPIVVVETFDHPQFPPPEILAYRTALKVNLPTLSLSVGDHELTSAVEGFTLAEEARNTERHHSWHTTQLRHAKVTFVSTGHLERPEVENANSSNKVSETPLESVVQDSSARDIVPKLGEGSLKSEEPHATLHSSSQPEHRSPSPAPSDSSGEVILFTGRRGHKEDDGKANAPSNSPQELSPIDSQLQMVEAELEEQKALLDEVVHPERHLASHSFVKSPEQIYPGFQTPEASGLDSKRQPRSHMQTGDDDLMKDYIATIQRDDNNLGLNIFKLHELDNLATSIAKHFGNFGGFDPSKNNDKYSRDGWDVSDLHDFDDMSTSDGVMGALQVILSKRERNGSVQYLVVWEDQPQDEARWVPAETLISYGAQAHIEAFEGQDATVIKEAAMSEDSSEAFEEMGPSSFNKMTQAKQVRQNPFAGGQFEALSASDMDLDALQLAEEDIDPVALDIDLLASVSHKNRSGGGRGSTRGARGDFPSATALADAYDAFDVMDFDRPSLSRKPKGRRTVPMFDISDSDLEASLQMAWGTDRQKKKQRKREREELRANGLLGSKDGKADLKQKYKEGIGFHDVKEEIKAFLLSGDTTLSLPPMGKGDRKSVHELASAFGLKSKSSGNGDKRFPILVRTQRTRTSFPDGVFEATEARIARRFLPRKDIGGKLPLRRAVRGVGGGGSNHAAASYRDGDVVGASAPELGVENKGRAMLEKMGWSTGTALGALNNKGILQPVSHVVKTTKAGLG